MADNSKIEWTDSTLNPIRARNLKTEKIGWYCEHVTTGCVNCYAESFNKRLGTGLPFKPGHRKDVDIYLDEGVLLKPLRWRKPRKVFLCSMTDIFADFVKDEWLDRIFAVAALTPDITYQVLTKRPERMREYFQRDRLRQRLWSGADFLACNLQLSDSHPGSDYLRKGKDDAPWPLPNVWLGVSAERQEEADARIPILLETPAAVRFISAEPLVQRIDLHYPDLDWVIVGGESGPSPRYMNLDWARDLRDQCADTGTAFFFKQTTGKGSIPDDLMVRQFPSVGRART